MSKGSGRRPSSVGRKEEELRWMLAMGKMTFDAYTWRMKQLKDAGEITRNGKVVKDGQII